MSMISEQIKRLRAYSNVSLYARENEVRELLRQAADTIEVLSEKVAETNMKRSNRYYSGGWIACEDRLPDKDDTVLIDADIGYFEIATYSGEGRIFYTEECGISCPVAWQPLPEPYALTNPSPTAKNTASHTGVQKP